MKTISKIFLVLIITCLNSSILLSQNQDSVKFVQSAKVSLINATKSFKNINLLLKNDLEVQTLAKELIKRGFSENMNKSIKTNVGIELNYPGLLGKVSNVLYVKDYISKTNENAALCQVRVSSGDRSEVYSFILISKDVKFQNVQEFYVDDQLQIQKANSWWSCMRGKLNNCTAPCAAAIVGCSGTWAAYLACVAVGCGSCYTYYAACCGCNCKYWCKWSVGCCRR